MLGEKKLTNKNIKIQLSKIGDGALEERFAHEMQRIADNIMDLNTEATKKRKIKIDVDFAPNQNRDSIDVSFTVKSTLAPEMSVGTTLLVGRGAKGTVVNELKSGVKGQTFFDADDNELKDDKGTKIIDIEKAGNN